MTTIASTLRVTLLIFGVATGAGAQQDTLKARRPSTTAVTSAGEVALSTYNAPAGDTAITRLEAFVTQYPQSTLRPRALLQLGELLVLDLLGLATKFLL